MAYRARSIMRKASIHPSCQSKSTGTAIQSDTAVANALRRQSSNFLQEIASIQGSDSTVASNAHLTTMSSMKIEWDYVIKYCASVVLFRLL